MKIFEEASKQARNEIESADDFEEENADNWFSSHMDKVRERASDIYQQKLLELSDQDLQDILFVHERGGIQRASFTIDNIMSELARRSILDDKPESTSKKRR